MAPAAVANGEAAANGEDAPGGGVVDGGGPADPESIASDAFDSDAAAGLNDADIDDGGDPDEA
jgi:hypothetical protein